MTLMNLPELSVLQWTIPAVPVVACTILLLLGLAVSLRCVKQKNSTLTLMGKEQDQLRQDLLALLRCSRGMGEQLRAQQRELRRLGERQFQVERRDASAPIRAAETLLENGAGSEEIVRRCGLSHSEAELMVHLEDLRQRETRNAA